jgi:hypothetical protein
VVAAEYIESIRLAKLHLASCSVFQELPAAISLLLRVSRNTSVTELIVSADVVKVASVAFQELLDLHADHPQATNIGLKPNSMR